MITRSARRTLQATMLWAGIVLPSFAHSMYQAAVLLDFRGGSVNVEFQLPLERVGAALGYAATPQSIESHKDRVGEYIVSHIHAGLPDGREFSKEMILSPRVVNIDAAPYVVAGLALTPPAGANAGLFDLRCDVLLDRIPSQVAFVSVRSDWRTSTFANEPNLLGVLRANSPTVTVDRRDGHWLRGFRSVFLLGVSHIAEGTDHLLFLLVLLLPAPLLLRDGRWDGHSPVRRCLWNIGKVVTAFTFGHSVTLAIGALDVVHLPSRPIEVLIAVSILISAVHAFRPLFPGREAVIAFWFGLVHGLAFAATLAELGLSRYERVASIFAFNLGIEAMQLAVVAAAMPPLLLFSRTQFYAALRISGASLAAIAAAGWITERLADVPNPIDNVVTMLAHRAGWIAAALTVLGALLRGLDKVRSRPRQPSETWPAIDTVKDIPTNSSPLGEMH